ncbi:MAG: polyketide synthase dehydratase domain-containing protein [Planctomycetota bacterium]|nr:polyketide synthase dehydratase domain-containing protein [Planctomycetota bacterium]
MSRLVCQDGPAVSTGVRTLDTKCVPLQTMRAASAGALHPLVQQRMPLAIGDAFFQSAISPDKPAYLVDHNVYGTVVFPGTGYLEIALAAGQLAAPHDAKVVVSLFGVTLKKPLILSPDTDSTIQVLISEVNKDGLSNFKISSAATSAEGEMASDLTALNKKSDRWNLHCKGQFSLRKAVHLAALDRARFEQDCTDSLSPGLFYRRLEQQGLNYGKQFQVVRSIRCGKQSALGKVTLEPATAASRYLLHPALLDGCFQILGGAFSEGSPGRHVLVPVGIEKLEVHETGISTVWCHVRLRNSDLARRGMLCGDLTLFAESGEIVAEVAGLWLARMAPEQLLPKPIEMVEDRLYQVQEQ